MSPVLWLVLGVGLLVVEVFTLTAFVGLVGIAALVAAGAAAVGAPTAVQVAAFGGTSVALVAFGRRPVQRMLERGTTSDSRTDPRALTGATVVVVERVDDDGGQVRLHGELWRARPYAGGAPIEPGRPAAVAAVEGATLLVYPPDLT